MRLDSGIAPVMMARSNDAAFHVLQAKERVIRTAESHRRSRSASSVRSVRAGTTSSSRPPSRASSAGSMRSLSSSSIGGASRSHSRPNSAAALLSSYNADLLKPQTPWPTRDSIDPSVLVAGSGGKVTNAKRGRVVASARLFASRLEAELRRMGLRDRNRVVFFRSMMAEVGLDALLAGSGGGADGSRPASATSSASVASSTAPKSVNPLEAYSVPDSDAALEAQVSRTIAHYDTNGDGIFEPDELRCIVRELLVKGQQDAAIRDEYEMTRLRLAMVEEENKELRDSAEFEALRATEAENVATKAKRREASLRKEVQASRHTAREAQVSLSAKASSDSSLAWARSQREHQLKVEISRARSFATEMERCARRSDLKQARAAELALEKQGESAEVATFARYQIIDLQRALQRAEQHITELRTQLGQEKASGDDVSRALEDAKSWIEGNAKLASEQRSIEHRLAEQAAEIEGKMGKMVSAAEERATEAESQAEQLRVQMVELQKRTEVAEYQRLMADKKVKNVQQMRDREKHALEKNIVELEQKIVQLQGDGSSDPEGKVREIARLRPETSIAKDCLDQSAESGRWTFDASSSSTSTSIWVSGISSTIPEGSRIRIEKSSGKGDGVECGPALLGNEWIFHGSLEQEGVGRLQAVDFGGKEVRSHGLTEEQIDSDIGGELVLVT